MGRPRKYESAADRQKAYLERQARGEASPGQVDTPGPKTPSDAPASVRHGERPTTGQFPKQKEEAPVDPVLEAELVEQQIRDHWGYSASETRTEAERHEAASRMLGRPSTPLTEQTYVDEALAQTWITLNSIHAPEKKTPEAVKARLTRAENYARWRYQGYFQGEIYSL